MSVTRERPGRPAPVWRWLAWSGFLAAWSAALLTTEPVHVAADVLPENAVFPASKLLHVGCYTVLTLLTGWLPVRRAAAWLLLFLPTAHAFATEYLQQFVPERGPSLVDVGIDHVGIVLGLALSWKWWRASLFGRDEPPP